MLSLLESVADSRDIYWRRHLLLGKWFLDFERLLSYTLYPCVTREVADGSWVNEDSLMFPAEPRGRMKHLQSFRGHGVAVSDLGAR